MNHLTTGISSNKYQLISTDTTKYECDYLYDELTHLVNPQFRAWYCKMFYQLGKKTVLDIAGRVKDHPAPQKKFSLLLKEAAQREQPTGG